MMESILQSALIVGANGGIGGALADNLEMRADWTVVRLTRSDRPSFDISDEQAIADAALQLKHSGCAPDLVIVASGILHRHGRGPEKSINEIDAEWMLENFRINAVGPVLVAKHFLPLMPRNRRICFAALSARVGSISDNRLGGWHSYRASKAALNMLIRNLAIEWQRKNPHSIIVGLHPGTVETRLSAPFQGNRIGERATPEMAAKRLLQTVEGLTPEQSGQLFSFDGTTIAP